MFSPFLRTIIIIVIVTCQSFLSAAQDKVLPVYFNTNSYTLSPLYQNKIDSFIQIIPEGTQCKIVIEGNTDSRGSDSSNMILAYKRIQAVRSRIQSLISAANDIQIYSWGESRPVNNNSTDAEMLENRRADIKLFYINTVQNEEKKAEPLPRRTIMEMYADLKPATQMFCISNKKDTMLATKAGSIIFIKAGSFPDNNECNCITIKVDEAFTKADIVSYNLSTQFGDQPLGTQGMIKITSECGNNKTVELKPESNYTVMMPVDTIIPTAKLFKGEWDDNNDMQWQMDTSSLSNFNALNAKDCLDKIRCGGNTPACERCNFFFCRIGNFFKGIGNPDQRETNAALRKCKPQFRVVRRRNGSALNKGAAIYASLANENKAEIDSLSAKWKVDKRYIADAMTDCAAFFKLMRKKEIEDMQALANVLQKLHNP